MSFRKCGVVLFVMRTVVLTAATWAVTVGAVLGQGATQLQVINASTEKVEIRVNNATGGTTSFLFTNGAGHFDPVPLGVGLGDRVVSVRRIQANGTVVLPSKVLAMSKFDPADAAQPILQLTFISGIAGYDIIYTTAEKRAEVGESVTFKGGAKGSELSAEQKKAVAETLKKSANKGGGI